MVFFDGLDELLDSSLREEVTTAIEHFASEYPHVPNLDTSRLIGYEEARLDDTVFSRYHIGGFDDERVRLYAKKWFRLQENMTDKAAEDWAESFMAESEPVPDLRSNPLMLSLMCILYRGEGSIPESRALIYERCATLLFQQWDTQRGIHVELRARHLVEPALRHLAFWLMTRGKNETAVAERQLVTETAKYFGLRGFETTEEATDAAKQFVRFCRGRAWVFSEAGTTSTGEGLYTFTHRTFLEYFAASYLSVSHDSPEQLARTLLPKVARHEWDVVAELAIQVKDRSSERGAERAINVLLTGSDRFAYEKRKNTLSFIVRCIDHVELPPSMIRQLTRKVIDLAIPHRRDAAKHDSLFNGLAIQGWRYRDTMLDEINSIVSAYMSSDDSAERIRGLSIVTSCDFDASSFGGDISKATFWQDAIGTYINLYRPQMEDLAESDGSVCHFLLRHGLKTVREVLTGQERGLAMIFGMVPSQAGGVIW
ncbi:MAG TPA: hypothetical protein VGE93_12365, partial [Bryobacteraceae bacterium]